jgi:hypothetical protein
VNHCCDSDRAGAGRSPLVTMVGIRIDQMLKR